MQKQENNATSIVQLEVDNQENELNAKSGQKVASGKIFSMILLVIGLLVGGFYGAYSYISKNLSTTTKPEVKTVVSADVPDSIGSSMKLNNPPLSENNDDQKNTSGETTDTTTQVVTPTTTSQEEETPLPDRRLASAMTSFENKTSPVTPARQARVMKNIDYTLIKGTKIPCTLETTIVSEQSGFTGCIINQDVYSGNARLLLLEKGTRVTGEYRSGDVKNGDSRLQIIWDRLITPYDIVIQLHSPTTDRLGAAGATGKVDNRWGKRIGSALLISMFSDALTVLADKKQSADVIVDSETSQTSQDMAKDILRHNIDLPPIIYIREGEIINIYVADDIDLSNIYDIRRM